MLRGNRCVLGAWIGFAACWLAGGSGAAVCGAAQPELPEPVRELMVVADGEGGFSLSLPGEGPFWETDRPVQSARVLELGVVEGGPDESPTLVVLWEEVEADGSLRPHRALGRVRLEGEEGMDEHVFPIVGETSYTVRLRYGELEPLGRYGSAGRNRSRRGSRRGRTAISGSCSSGPSRWSSTGRGCERRAG